MPLYSTSSPDLCRGVPEAELPAAGKPNEDKWSRLFAPPGPVPSIAVTPLAATPAPELAAVMHRCAEQAARIAELELEVAGLRQRMVTTAPTASGGAMHKISKRLKRALGRRHYYFLLEAAQGVERVGTFEHSYRSTQSTLQFALIPAGDRLPYGWVKVSTRYAFNTASNPRLRLLPDFGAGPSKEDSFELTTSDSAEGRITIFYYVAPTLQQLKLDILDVGKNVRFELDSVTMLEVTKQEALAGLLMRRARAHDVTNSSWPQTWAKLVPVLKPHGLSLLLDRLYQHDRQASLQYVDWVEHYDTLTDEDRVAMLQRSATLPWRPKISIVMPIFNTPDDLLGRAIASVQAQCYENWELCLADDASTQPHIAATIAALASSDDRIQVVHRPIQGHICAATNDALALATGEFVVFLDHDDELREHALFLLATTLNANTNAKLIYSDEDKLTCQGVRYDPYFKPDWNPDLLRSQNYINHLTCFHLQLVRDVGALRLGYEGSQDYDLLLRATQHLGHNEIHHIPHVLYMWRAAPGSTAHTSTAKAYTFKAAQRALEDDLQRRGLHAIVKVQSNGYLRTQFELPAILPLVSIIIPTRDQVSLLRQCVRSIEKKTAYSNYEIIIVDNDSKEESTHIYLQSLQTNPRIRVLPYHKAFNYAAINNEAVAQARGDVLCLLNNDIEVINTGWLDELVSQAMRSDIGAVGAKLYYADGTLQHAGVVLGLGGIAGHAFKHLHVGGTGQMSRANLVQNYAAVTGACLAIRKETYTKVGGLDETLQVAFNDVDFCLRVGDLGLRNLYTPFAELYHHESATRGTDFTPIKAARLERESVIMRERWGDRLITDASYNPNLTLKSEDFTLAWPPRVARLST